MSLEMAIMTQIQNANAIHPAADQAGRMAVVLPKTDVIATSASDPLPWLIRNLRDKQKAERQNLGAGMKPQASTGDANPIG